MEVFKRTCIKPFEITALNGDHFKCNVDQEYTVSRVMTDRDEVMVFSNYWVRVPLECFGPPRPLIAAAAEKKEGTA